ncbi:MAG: 16S rRNA (uracil(1498)-N(3))-methyltransferase [Nitrospirota bacterium]
MPRIFIPDIIPGKDQIKISDEKARYLRTVLRCKTGDQIIVNDDKGNSYTARITGATGKEITAEIIEKIFPNPESFLNITFLQGILKGDRMDLVIQKATELGVMEIIPVVTERSQIRETKKLPRWRKIAEEASKQSGRTAIPVVHEVMNFQKLFSGSDTIKDTGIIFWEKGGESLTDVFGALGDIDRIKLFTGPEGGFSEKEVNIASERGFKVATLGKRILRAETAAIAALSIVQYELGDLGGVDLTGSKI